MIIRNTFNPSETDYIPEPDAQKIDEPHRIAFDAVAMAHYAEEHRIERLNREMFNAAQRMRRYAERQNFGKVDEASEYLNGLREAAEILGYAITYRDGIPQIEH